VSTCCRSRHKRSRWRRLPCVASSSSRICPVRTFRDALDAGCSAELPCVSETFETELGSGSAPKEEALRHALWICEDMMLKALGG